MAVRLWVGGCVLCVWVGRHGPVQGCVPLCWAVCTSVGILAGAHAHIDKVSCVSDVVGAEGKAMGDGYAGIVGLRAMHVPRCACD